MKELICAVLTKFDGNGHLLLDDEYEEFINWLIEGGVNVLMPCGTNGEFHVMSLDERKEVMNYYFSKFSSRVEVMPHVGAASFKETKELADYAFSLGAKRITVVLPYYFKYDEKALIDYYVSLAKAFHPKKILIYNIPSFAGTRISPRAILKIKEGAENVVGLKDTDARPYVVSYLKKNIGEDFKVYGGNDKMVLEYLIRGADGSVSGSSNVAPWLLRALLDAFESGEMKEASRLQGILDRLVENVTGTSFFVGSNKLALKELGFDVGYPRSPSRIPDQKEKEGIVKVLREILNEKKS